MDGIREKRILSFGWRRDSFEFVTLIIFMLGIAGVPETADSAGGTAEVKVTTVSYDGKYANKNIGAIWIENSAGQFVKSLEVWAKKREKHLIKWKAASGGNKVDAVTSATSKSHKSHVATWDGSDADGNTVPDGRYTVVIEFTEDNSASSGKPPGKWTTIEFTVGGGDQTVSPPDQANFKGLKLVYSGSGTSSSASLAGRVTADGSGQAVSGALVQLKSGGSVQYESQSLSTGDYAFASVTPGSYSVVCSKQGFVTWSSNKTLASGDTASGFDINLVPEGNSDTTPPEPPKNVQVSSQ